MNNIRSVKLFPIDSDQEEPGLAVQTAIPMPDNPDGEKWLTVYTGSLQSQIYQVPWDYRRAKVFEGKKIDLSDIDPQFPWRIQCIAEAS
jgi:hypothetical protein